MTAIPTSADEIVAAASGGEHLGDVVFLRLWQATTSHAKVLGIAQRHGFPADMVPNPLSPEGAFLATMRTTKMPEGWFLREVAKDKERIVWDAVHETVDHDARLLEYPQGARIRFTFARDSGRLLCGDISTVAAIVKNRKAELSGTVTTRMVRRMANQVCKAHDGIQIGSEWFVPARHSQLMRSMRGLIGEMGDSQVWLLPVFDSADSRQTLSGAVASSMETDLQELRKEIEAFTNDTRKGALERRLQDFEALRAKAGLYRDMLGVAQDALLGRIGEMERHVAGLLGAKS